MDLFSQSQVSSFLLMRLYFFVFWLKLFFAFLVYLREQDTPSLWLPSFFHSVVTIFSRQKIAKKVANLAEKIGMKATIWRGKREPKRVKIFTNRKGNDLNISKGNKKSRLKYLLGNKVFIGISKKQIYFPKARQWF